MHFGLIVQMTGILGYPQPLVRLAREAGPQHVTVHGRDAVVVVSAEDYARLVPAANAGSLADLFGTGPFTRLDDFGTRETSPVRDLADF